MIVHQAPIAVLVRTRRACIRLFRVTSGDPAGMSCRQSGNTAARGFEPRLSVCATTQTMLLPRASWRARWTRFVRGDIYRLKDARGHEQTGSRFAVVVQSDDLHLSTWLVAPTSTGRREASFRPEIDIDGVKTRVMVEQLTVVDPQLRLGEFAGRLGGEELHAVDAALLAVLGLD